MPTADLDDECIAGDVSEIEVREDEIEARAAVELCQRLLGARTRVHLVTAATQDPRQRPTDQLVVFDEQDPQ